MAEKVHALTVFCGARSGHHPEYEQVAYQLGAWLAEKKWQLVYGGGSVGLMGAVARGCFENGGHVVGVIPEALKVRELDFKQAQELIVVKTMHERKSIMNQRGDAFLTLPGGFGTLEEIFEVITWRQLGFHQKPMYFLNQDSYYSELQNFISVMQKKGFVSQEDCDRVRFIDSLQSWKDLWKK